MRSGVYWGQACGAGDGFGQVPENFGTGWGSGQQASSGFSVQVRRSCGFQVRKFRGRAVPGRLRTGFAPGRSRGWVQSRFRFRGSFPVLRRYGGQVPGRGSGRGWRFVRVSGFSGRSGFFSLHPSSTCFREPCKSHASASESRTSDGCTSSRMLNAFGFRFNNSRQSLNPKIVLKML